LLIKYIKSVLWRVAKCLSYIEEARCLKINRPVKCPLLLSGMCRPTLIKTIQHERTLQYVQRLWSVGMWTDDQTGQAYLGYF